MKEKFFSWLRKLNLPSKEELVFTYESFNKNKKLTVIVLAIIFIISFLTLVNKLNNKLMVDVPVAGGALTEGIVGTPRFINPLLAVSDADRDLTSLTYSGLLRLAPGRGYEPDLADRYDISDDGLTYTFHLKKNLRWSDGESLTAKDVVFTIEQAQDQNIKSPKRASWNGVIVKALDDRTIQFSLKKPYNFFLDSLTLGILPEHLWGKVKTDQFPLAGLNTNPVGSGPYEVASVNEDSAGIPISYNLRPNKNFVLGAPKVDLTIRFYNSDQELLTALERGGIGSVGAIAPVEAAKLAKAGQTVLQAPLPRIFAVFLNQNHNQVFVDPVIRRALDLAIDRQKLINEVLIGYGAPIDSPLPSAITSKNSGNRDGLQKAQELLTANHWQIDSTGNLTKNTPAPKPYKDKKTGKLVTPPAPKNQVSGPVTFTLATANISELKTAARILQTDWGKLGIKVNLEFYEPGDLNQEVIRPRKYDALLFGEVIGRDYDLYPFWHSSQRLDPGLNIAMYVNSKVDKLLEQIRESANIQDLAKEYENLATEINKDQPAVFLYQPDFLYVVPKGLKGVYLPTIANPADRFAQIYQWYFRTDRVWSIFAKIISYF